MVFGEDKTALQVQGRMSDFSGDKENGLGGATGRINGGGFSLDK